MFTLKYVFVVPPVVASAHQRVQEKSSAGCLTEPEEPPSPPPLSPTAADVGPDVRAAEQSPQRRAAQSPYAAEAREGDPPPSRAQRVQNWLFKAGDTILHGMEFVGEVVAGVLGIDEVSSNAYP